ncbi:MAG: hypothetical protein IPK34_17195 [Ramlibacter sp.]|nr:hypothetical protein [Ramlibacter sp.]
MPTPGAPTHRPPAVPNANNANLLENIERQKLAVDRILPLHGRMVTLAGAGDGDRAKVT